MEPLEPLVVPFSCAPCPSPSIKTYLESRKPPPPPQPESGLLKSIRATLRGGRTDSDPGILSQVYSFNDELIGEEELSWDSQHVLLSMGGVIRKRWDLSSTGQPVQWACIAFLQAPSAIHIGSAIRPEYHTYDSQEPAQSELPDPSQRPTFGPFSSAHRRQKAEKENATRLRAVVIFLRSLAKVYFNNGMEYSFYVPFLVRRVWQLRPLGIVIQRFLDPNELEEAKASGEPPLPTIFTMVSPIAEAAVMGLTNGITGGFRTPMSLEDENSKKPMNTIPAQEHVVWVSASGSTVADDLIVTLDPETRVLSVWRYAYIPGQKATDSGRKKSKTAKPRNSLLGTPSRHRRVGSVGSNYPQSPPPPQRNRDLRDLPGLPPVLSEATTMASLMQTQGSVLPPLSFPPISQAKGDISETLDRITLGGRLDGESGIDTEDIGRMKAAFWMEKLYSEEISPADAEAWRNVTAGAFNQDWSGKGDVAHFGICLPMSKLTLVLSLNHQSGSGKIVAEVVSRIPAVSVAPIKALRPGTMDLLVVREDHSLSLITYGLSELPIQLVSNERSLPAGPLKITSIRDGQRSSVTIVLSNGLELRISINLFPCDTLTQQCFAICTFMLPTLFFFYLHRQFLLQWSRDCYSNAGDDIFSAFSSALFTSLGFQSSPVDKAGSSPWAALGGSLSHRRFQDDPALIQLKTPHPHPQIKSFSSQKPHPYTAPVLCGLHYVAQMNLIAVDRYEMLFKLIPVLCRLAAVVRPEWAEYWKRFYPDAIDEWPSTAASSLVDNRLQIWPPDLWVSYYGRIVNAEYDAPWVSPFTFASHFKIVPCLAFGRADPLEPLRVLTQAYSCLSKPQLPPGRPDDVRTRAEYAMKTFVNLASPEYVIGRLPLGFASPIREAARTCQLSPQGSWPVALYRLIGRNDLAEGITDGSNGVSTHGYRSVKEHINSTVRKSFYDHTEEVRRAIQNEVGTTTGVELNSDDFVAIRFGQDRRLEEVSRMLCSSIVPVIKMIERPEMNEHDLAKEQQHQVIRMAERTLALPLGRALFTFGTVPVVTREAYAIPKIEYSIRLQAQNILVSPDVGKIPQDCISWGEFHNGVAAGLRISPYAPDIESSWIKFNKPSELTPEHAGYLFALGLTGHLRQMLTWHTFSYLTPKHDLTSIAVLLGLSAAHVGTSNRHVTKLIAVHTPALLPTPNVDLNVPLITQAAGLAGIGLLYMGTKNRRMAEVCLNQISRKDLVQPDLSNEYREAYTLTSALAFGMITLGKGANIPADNVLLSRLEVLIHGQGHTSTDKGRPPFDINLTSPAATIALGLMYLRTERQDVADTLAIPDTILTLDRVQPNFLLLRTLARALIMWDGITPTKEWMNAQIPASINRAMEARTATGAPVSESYELAYYNIVAGCCFSIALKFAGTAREEAYVLIIRCYDMFSQLAFTNGPAFDHRIRKAAIRDGLNLISISLNMIMAGTGEINCLRRLRYAYGMYNQPIRYGTHVANHVSLGLLFLGGGRYTLGTSDAAIVCMIAAFFPRFAQISSDNKTYLQALRHLWVLAVEPRCLVARDVDTKEVVYLPIKIKAKDGKEAGTAQLIAPTLIPDLDKLLSIRVDTPRYWPFYLDMHNFPHHKESLLQSQTLFVKRRTAFLSYMEDPKGSRSLFVRSGSATGDAATLDYPQSTEVRTQYSSDLHEFISSFSNDTLFLAFADWFCRDGAETHDEKTLRAYCYAVLLDSILQDKPSAIQSHLTLQRYRRMSPKSRYFNLMLQDTRFAVEFCSKAFDRRFSGRSESNGRPPMIRETSLSGIIHNLDKQLDALKKEPVFRDILRRFTRCEEIPAFPPGSPAADASRNLAWYLQRQNVPGSSLLAVLKDLASKTSRDHTLGALDEAELSDGITEILHATGTQMTAALGPYWSIQAVQDVIGIWNEEISSVNMDTAPS